MPQILLNTIGFELWFSHRLATLPKLEIPFFLTIYHMDADQVNWEKARRKLRKNATNYIEQILEATSHKIAAVRPPTSNL